MIIDDYIANLALEAGKNHIKDQLDERRIKADIKKYLQNQKRYHEVSSLADEFDFQGLMDYISTSFLDDVTQRVFDPNSKLRAQARETLVNKAVHYSHAKTDEARKRVAVCISSCVDIVRRFYTSITIRDYIIASAIVDAVDQNTREVVRSSEERIMSTIQNGSLFSIRKAIDLVKARDFAAIENGFEECLKHISAEHPLFPDFGYDYSNGQLSSIALTEEGKRKYPEKYVFVGPVHAGNKTFTDPHDDPVDYSYRHQIPIVMEVYKATKYLGSIEDPIQEGVKRMVGGRIEAVPPKFPSAAICNITVGTQTCFENVALRLQEILDNGTHVIGNKEQGGAFYFEILFNKEDPDQRKFSITIKASCNRDILQFVKFMDALNDSKSIYIQEIQTENDLMVCHIDSLGYRSGFSSIKEEIDFLERLCCIEDYFGIKLKPEESILQQEYEGVKFLSDLINNDKVDETWKEATFKAEVGPDIRKKLKEMKDHDGLLSYIGISKVRLFGTDFEVKFMRSYLSARIAAYDELLQRIDLLENGDTITIKLIPGENNDAFISLHVPDLADS